MWLLVLACIGSAATTTYYVAPTGNDTWSGISKDEPWFSAAPLSTMRLSAGDEVLFEGGTTYFTYLSAHEWRGTASKPIRISSYDPPYGVPGQPAVIHPIEWAPAIQLYQPEYVTVEYLKFVGPGPLDHPKVGWALCGLCVQSNRTDRRLEGLVFRNIESSGFRSGVSVFTQGNQPYNRQFDCSIYGFNNVILENIRSHNNRDFGIRVQGCTMSNRTDPNPKYQHTNFVIRNCTSHDIPGNPGGENQGPTGPSTAGMGIRVAGLSTAVIERCLSYNIGWLNGYKDNGACGYMVYLSSFITITHSVAHHIYNGYAGVDGNGFGLDGGTINSVMEYSYSFYNDGTGFYIDQYWNAPFAANNSVRYSVSYYDGQYGEIAGLLTFADPHDQQHSEANCTLYGNTVFTGPAVSNRYNGKRPCGRGTQCQVTGKPSAVEYPWYNAYQAFPNTIIHNNVFITEGDAPSVSLPPEKKSIPESYKMDYNFFWTDGNPFMFQYSNEKGNLTAGWELYKKLTGWEEHGTWGVNPHVMTKGSTFFQNCVQWEGYYPVIPNSPMLDNVREWAGC